jgi:hypothetical protein
MSRREKQLSQKRIRSALLTGVFNPRTPSPFKIVADIGNVDYLIVRANEYLFGAKGGNKIPNLQNALSLIALAICKIEDETKNI